MSGVMSEVHPVKSPEKTGDLICALCELCAGTLSKMQAMHSSDQLLSCSPTREVGSGNSSGKLLSKRRLSHCIVEIYVFSINGVGSACRGVRTLRGHGNVMGMVKDFREAASWAYELCI